MEAFVCNFDPTLFTIGTFSVRFYGLAYLASFLLVLFFVPYQLRIRQEIFSKQKIYDLLFWIFVCMIIGARLGYFIFYNSAYFISDPLEIFRVWNGGMSFHGGLIGVAISGIILAPKYNLSRKLLADLLIFPSCLALMLGRLANFLNCEIWGRAYSGPLAMIFPRAGDIPRHPAQLYGAALYLLVFIILYLLLVYRRPRFGVLFSAGLTLLGTARFINEFFREPDYFVYDWLTIGQLLSIPLILIGLFFFFILNKRK